MNHEKQGADSSMNLLMRSVSLLKRHVWSIAISIQVLAVLGITAVALIPDVYLATTTILVDPQKIPERYVTSTVTSDPNARLNALTQLVLSATKLQEIVDRLDLYPKLRQKKSREELLDYVRTKIKIEVKSGSEQGLSSFSISYEDPDRFIVAPMANQLATSFISWNLRVREQQAMSTSLFLTGELEQAKSSLEAQENELKGFRVAHEGETPDDLGGNLQAMSTLQGQLQANVDAIGRLDEERILLTQTTHPADSRDASELPERTRLLQERGRLESDYSNLRREYTESYPDVISLKQQLETVNTRLAVLPVPVAGSAQALDSNTRVRLELVNQQLLRRNEQQEAFRRKLTSYQTRIDAVPALQMQLAALTRNYDVSKQNYQSLFDKSISAGMARDLESKQEAERFTPLDTAKTPEKPFSPKRLPMIGAVLLVSFILPCAAVLGLELLLRRIELESDIQELVASSIEIIGRIPPIISEADKQRKRLLRLRAGAFSVASAVTLALVLLKVKPIL